MLSVAVQLNLHKKGEGDMSEATIQGCINHVVNDYFVYQWSTKPYATTTDLISYTKTSLSTKLPSLI
jgi:hypothetical protein